MKRLIAILLLLLAVNAHAAARFVAFDVVIESQEPVAAWQFELRDQSRRMTVVGIQNGDSPVFSKAPFYDRDAVEMGTARRIIVADYSLAVAEELPRGSIRLATVHVMLDDGDADFDLQLITANTPDGRRIDAPIQLIERTGSSK